MLFWSSFKGNFSNDKADDATIFLVFNIWVRIKDSCFPLGFLDGEYIFIFQFYVNASYACVLCTEPRWMECTGEREEVKKKVLQKVSVGVQTSMIRNMLASFFAPTQASACGPSNDTTQDR